MIKTISLSRLMVVWVISSRSILMISAKANESHDDDNNNNKSKQHWYTHARAYLFSLWNHQQTAVTLFLFMLCKTTLKNYINKIGENIYERRVVWRDLSEMSAYRWQNKIEKLTEN